MQWSDVSDTEEQKQKELKNFYATGLIAKTRKSYDKLEDISPEPGEVAGPAVYMIGEGDKKEEFFPVGKVLNAKDADGDIRLGRQLYYYLVQFEGYPESENKWMHEDQLKNASKAIDDYWTSKGSSRYEIEKILSHKLKIKKGEAFYVYEVKWLGFEEIHFLAEEDFIGAKEMLDEYKRNVGLLSGDEASETESPSAKKSFSSETGSSLPKKRHRKPRKTPTKSTSSSGAGTPSSKKRGRPRKEPKEDLQMSTDSHNMPAGEYVPLGRLNSTDLYKQKNGTKRSNTSQSSLEQAMDDQPTTSAGPGKKPILKHKLEESVEQRGPHFG